jgi:hypothetical protein
VPNRAVEVWWQSHLLRPASYRQFCLARYGAVVDRIVVNTMIGQNSAETLRVWREEYGADDRFEEPKFAPAPKAALKEGAAAALAADVASGVGPALEREGLCGVSDLLADRTWLPTMHDITRLNTDQLCEDDVRNGHHTL